MSTSNKLSFKSNAPRGSRTKSQVLQTILSFHVFLCPPVLTFRYFVTSSTLDLKQFLCQRQLKQLKQPTNTYYRLTRNYYDLVEGLNKCKDLNKITSF